MEKEKIEKKYTVYDCIDAIKYKNELDFNDNDVCKAYDIFLINRLLSYSDVLVPIVHMINNLNLSKQNHFRLLYSLIPKGNYRYEFARKESKKDNIKYISDYFECGSNDAKMIIKMIKEIDIKRIIECFDEGGLTKIK